MEFLCLLFAVDSRRNSSMWSGRNCHAAREIYLTASPFASFFHTHRKCAIPLCGRTKSLFGCVLLFGRVQIFCHFLYKQFTNNCFSFAVFLICVRMSSLLSKEFFLLSTHRQTCSWLWIKFWSWTHVSHDVCVCVCVAGQGMSNEIYEIQRQLFPKCHWSKWLQLCIKEPFCNNWGPRQVQIH